MISCSVISLTCLKSNISDYVCFFNFFLARRIHIYIGYKMAEFPEQK